MSILGQKIVLIFRNAYVIISFAFLVWLLFFDSEDIVTEYILWRKIKELEKEKILYKEKIKKITLEQEGINNPETLKKIAREKYYMKKKTEDLYVIID